MTRSDRRVRRTKASLRRALIELLTERELAAISVAAIVERADVGRSTFYAHYADKEELLRESLSALGAHVRQPPPDDASVPAVLALARPLLQHVDEVRPMFTALLDRRSPAVVQEAFLDTVRGVLREHVDDEATIHYVAAGFLALARWWVLEAPQLDVDEVYLRFVRLTSPILRG